MGRVFDDADHRDPVHVGRRHVVGKGDALADGVDVWPVAFRHLVVDHHDFRSAGAVGGRDEAPAQQLDLHRLVVSRCHQPLVAPRTGLSLGSLKSLDVEAAGGPVASERDVRRRTDRVDTRQRRQPEPQGLEERGTRFRCRVLGAWESDVGRHEVGRLEAGADALQQREAANQQARSHQQRQRKRDLGDDQCAAKPLAGGLAGRPGAVLQGVVQVGARGVDGGGDAEEQPREHRDPQCEQQHGAVDLNRLDPEQVHRHCRDEPTNGAKRDGQAHHCADHRQQHAFGEQLPNQVRPCGPHRRPHRHFTRPRCSPGQQQVGDVGARDEQHEADRADQDQQRRLDAARRHLVHRAGRDGPLAAVGIGKVVLECHRECRDVAFGLLDADAGLEASGGDEKLVGPAVVAVLLGREHRGRPEVGVASEEVVEPDWHDPEDVVGLAVEQDLAPDH